jgi:hypothetical protein
MANQSPRQSDRPRADYVGHPAMDAGSYRVEYHGMYTHPGHESIWCKRMEMWRESGQQCGAWHWVRYEEVPLGADRS